MTTPSSPDFKIYPAFYALEKAESLRPVLESAVRDSITGEIISGEVDDILHSVEANIKGPIKEPYYLVAKASGGALLGVMGIQVPGEKMQPFAVTDSPLELINACVLDTARGLGVGKALVESLEAAGKSWGFKEVIVNSGPRYQRTGWPFWDKMYGEPAGIAKDYYGSGFDAMVWRKSLTEAE